MIIPRRHCCLTLLAVLPLSLPVPASAAEEGIPLRLTIRKARAGLLDRDRDWQHLEKIPGGTSQTGAESWEDKRALTLQDMLGYVPGVSIQPRNSAESARLSIRGSGLSRNFQGRGVLLLQDGIPVNSADGTFDFQSIDPWLIDYIDVVRGANGLAYGASNLGGVINFISSTGYTGNGYQLRGEIGSFGMTRMMAAAGRQEGAADSFAAVTRFTQDGERDNSAQESSRFTGNAGWKSSSVEHRLFFTHIKTNPEIPGTLSRHEVFTRPELANPSNQPGRYARDLQIDRTAYRSLTQLENGTFESTLFANTNDLENPVTTYIKSQGVDGGARLRYQGKWGDTRLTLGANAHGGRDREKRFTNVSGNAGAPVVNRTLEATTSEIYGEAAYPLTSALQGIASLQGSYATRGIAESYPATQAKTWHFSSASPRVGMLYDYSDTLSFFGNLSRSVEPPALSELSSGNTAGFSALDPQQALTLEWGTRVRYYSSLFEVTFYAARLQDELVNYRFADNRTATTNVSRTKHMGAEIGASGNLASDLLAADDWLDYRTAYTWSRYTLDNDPLYGDLPLPGIPEHYLRGELTYAHPSGWHIGPNAVWAPANYPVDLTNTLHASGYALAGASAGYDIPGTQASLYIDAHNLLDRRYIATTNIIPDAAGIDSRQFFPGSGRAFYAGIRARW